ncbi:MAG: flippase-like domain-containing protein [Thermoplasmata archaeon]|nr:flippase-like domain-containing protein [Thermoplasmata archaeon]MBE3136833.1 flippase-like domain-containing protein [Thermoplasmata archaeon]
MVKNLLKKAKIVLPFIGLIILAYIIYSLDVHKIITAFLSIDPKYIVYALILTLPLLFLRNAAWQLILREQKIQVGFFRSLKIYLIGVFYGSITPGYYGQLMRVPYLKEKTGEPFGKLFINTVIETFVHTFSLYGMMIIGALLVVGTLPELLPITIAWILGLAFITAYFVKRERSEKLFKILINYIIPKKVKPHFNAFVDTFYIDFPRFKAMILPFVLGIFTWIIVFSQEYMILLGLGLQIPFFAFLLLFPIANVAGFIPITFAGLGTREFTAIFIFTTLFQVAGEQILVLSLVGFIVTDLFLGFLGFLLSLTESRITTSLPEMVDQ